MKWLAVVLLFASSLSAQTNNYRWDYFAFSVSGGGFGQPMLALPGATIYFYACTNGVCNTAATTYQSATSTSQCPQGQQVTWQLPAAQGCQSATDSTGNFGGWFQPGQYAYIINGVNGPRYFTVGGTGVSPTPEITTCLGGTATAISGISYSQCYGSYIKLSTTTPPVSGGGTTWVYTLASPISSAAASQINGSNFVISGFTGAAAGNNVSSPAAATVTTTTISLSNGTGTTANTGAPVFGSPNNFDVRSNLCLSDAENLTNGNITGICDSSTEPTVVTQYGQINVGDGSHSVLWKLGPALYSDVNLTGGTAYAVKQNSLSSILCEAAQNSGCAFNNFSGTNGMYALYGTGTTTGYRRLQGVWFKSIHGGTLASGNVCQIQAGYDGSTWQDMQCIDDATSNVGNGTAAVIGGNTFCCHSNFINDWFGSEWGQTALSITAPQFDQVNALNFHNTTINSHNATATGNPNLLCTDAYHTQTAISFTGTTYMEGQAAAMSAPFVQDNGCRALEFSGITEASVLGGTGSTAPIIAIGNTFDTTLNVADAVEYQGNGTNPWTWPGTVVEQYNTTSDCGSPPCAVAVTDSAGNSPGYHSRTTQFNNVKIGGVLQLGPTTLNSGSGVPSGACASGSTYTNTAGTTGGINNLYVCSQAAWLAVK